MTGGGEQAPVDPAPEACMPEEMTLESIIDITGEMEHLNALVLLHLEQCGGFTTPDAYFATVRPLLDQLEEEIRARYEPGMGPEAVGRIIAAWIDAAIVVLQ